MIKNVKKWVDPIIYKLIVNRRLRSSIDAPCYMGIITLGSVIHRDIGMSTLMLLVSISFFGLVSRASKLKKNSLRVIHERVPLPLSVKGGVLLFVVPVSAAERVRQALDTYMTLGFPENDYDKMEKFIQKELPHENDVELMDRGHVVAMEISFERPFLQYGSSINAQYFND